MTLYQIKRNESGNSKILLTTDCHKQIIWQIITIMKQKISAIDNGDEDKLQNTYRARGLCTSGGN